MKIIVGEEINFHDVHYSDTDSRMLCPFNADTYIMLNTKINNELWENLINYRTTNDSSINKTKIDNKTKNGMCVMDRLEIKEVIFHDPATIIYWNNGDKTVVKCGEKDIYDPEKGLAMAILKYLYGNKTDYHKLFKNYIPEKVNKEHDDLIKTMKQLFIGTMEIRQ